MVLGSEVQNMKRKIKNGLLKGITTVAVVVLILCICALDSDVSWIYRIAGACMLWIGAMMLANRNSL